MVAAEQQELYTVEEYFELELASEIRYEYYQGYVLAMAGASEAHNMIAVNVSAILHTQFRGRPCRHYQSDMRVAITQANRYTYPDLTIVCGDRRFVEDRPDTLLNPTLIIEILSASTQSYDRGEKFQHYRTLESLQKYVLISQDSAHIETYLRQGEQWLLTDTIGLDGVAKLKSIDCSLTMSDVYERVEFETKAEVESEENSQADG